MRRLRLRWFAPAFILAALTLVLVTAPGGRPATRPVPHNGVWLDRHWLRGERTPAEMEALLHDMLPAGIVYLFIHAGPFGPDGSVPAYAPQRVGALKQAARRVSPDFQLVAWLGGRNAAEGGDVDISTVAVRQRAARAAADLVAAGFDGVQLNIEPLADGDPHFLLLLDDVRSALPQGALLGAATNLWRPAWLSNRYLFGDGYLAAVAARVDQVAVMNYDTYAVSPALFQRVSAAQTGAALRVVAAANPKARVLMGLPGYPTEGGLRHNAWAESTERALAGIDAGLARAPNRERRAFEGVALYAGWTATADDWQAMIDWQRREK